MGQREFMREPAERGLDHEHLEPQLTVEEDAGLSTPAQRPLGPEAGMVAMERLAGVKRETDEEGKPLPLRIREWPELQVGLGLRRHPAQTRPEEGQEHGAAKAKAQDQGAKGAKGQAQATGIASSIAIDRFVAAAKKVQSNWDHLSAQKRATELAEAANVELKAVNVPETSPVLKDLGDDAGQFDFSTWNLDLGRGAFAQKKVDDKAAADVADTIYHESRHCEQWFRMARLEAGSGKKKDEIVDELGVPARIATEAGKQPLSGKGSEAREAQTWYDSVYGKNADARDKTLGDLDTKAAAVATAEAHYDKVKAKANSTATEIKAARDAWSKAAQEYEQVYQAYRNLPEEADAWRVGGAVTHAYLQK